jgi:hypothetical protein
LLHPFLQYLFKDLGLLDEADQFAGEAAQQKAVHLLVFLAGGSASAPWEWTMEKWLCGLDMDAFVPADLSLTEAEVLACNQLLQAVIGHWRPLNDSSTAALQETFLQRHGKLWPEGDGWHLALEKTGVDILLDQLPWGIGVIRLPWAAQNLFTTW